MNLKEAFQAQNKIEQLFEYVSNYLCAEKNLISVTEKHFRSKAAEGQQDEKIAVVVDNKFPPDKVIDFLMLLIDEREKLARAIHVAKIFFANLARRRQDTSRLDLQPDEIYLLVALGDLRYEVALARAQFDVKFARRIFDNRLNFTARHEVREALKFFINVRLSPQAQNYSSVSLKNLFVQPD